MEMMDGEWCIKEHSQKLIGVLWHFNPLALVASYVAHIKLPKI